MYWLLLVNCSRLGRPENGVWRGMLRRLWILLPVILLCLVVGAKEAPREAPSPREASSQTPGRPNILLVLTDDQDAGSVSKMPNVHSRLIDRGTTFENAFATTPLCCPSRASILRGQYAHNHKLWDNKAPAGGFEGFQKLGLEESTVATWLDEAGYHTGFIGKYLNEYGSYDDPTTHVPPGWDRWVGYQGGPGAQNRNGAFKVNDQGKMVRIDATEEHDTDYFARKAQAYVKNRKTGAPWFLMIATNAPHAPARASARNENAYAGHTMPKTPSFNEADASDKAAMWRDNPLLPEECPRDYREKSDLQCVPEADEVWRNRMESLRDVDDMVGGLLAVLREEGFAQDTYVILTSDNGFALYRNRIFSKGAPYESSQRIPFIVRGPGVPKGRVDHRLVANIDLAPTFAQWAEGRMPGFVDGRSLVPILANPDAPWRTRLLFEHRLAEHDFRAVRTSADQVYIEYPLAKETEYYDLDKDPYQLDGEAEKPPPQLETRLEELMRCAGASCRVADGNDSP
jgi:N-acetylglucosamine-6-sulfatase